MKKFVIEGKSMLDKFLEWIGEKVREGRGRLERGEEGDTKLIESLRFCSGENLVFVVELS